MAGFTRKTYGGAPDRRALVTDRGVDTGVGCTLTASAFTGKPGVTDGVVPALYPVVVAADGKATPFAGTSGSAKPLSGFTLNVVDISGGDAVTGYMSRGDIDPAKLPIPFAVAGVDAASAPSFKFDAKA